MIKSISQRYEPFGDLCGPPIERNQPEGKALAGFLKFEVGFGGKIVQIESDDERLEFEVHTSLFLGRRYDRTLYKAKIEDAKMMALAIKALVTATNNDEFTEARINFLARVLEGNAALVISSGAGLLMGAGLARAVALSVLGRDVKEEHAESFVEQMKQFNSDTLYTFLELNIDDGIPVETLMNDEELWKEAG